MRPSVGTTSAEASSCSGRFWNWLDDVGAQALVSSSTISGRISPQDAMLRELLECLDGVEDPREPRRRRSPAAARLERAGWISQGREGER